MNTCLLFNVNLIASHPPINRKLVTVEIEAYLLNDPKGRKNYVQMLKLDKAIESIDIDIQKDAEKFGYTSAFNWMLRLALGDPKKPSETTRKRPSQSQLPKSFFLPDRITRYAYPKLIGLIEDRSLPVINRRGEDCKYPFLKQAPDEIELPNYRNLPAAITRHSTEFYSQFDMLKGFFIPVEQATTTSMNKKIDSRRQQTGTVGVSPEKIKAMKAARDIAEKLWLTEEHKNKRISDMVNEVYSELYWSDFNDQLPDKKRMNDWIRSVAPEHAKKGGRPKK